MFLCGGSDALDSQFMEVAWKEIEAALGYLTDMFSNLHSFLHYIIKFVS